MPRVLPDHRSRKAGRLRHTYEDLLGRFKVLDGVARRVAVLAAENWLTYEDLGVELVQAPRKKKSAQEISRMRRRRQAAAGHFLGGLRTLEFLSSGNGQPHIGELYNLPPAGDSE